MVKFDVTDPHETSSELTAESLEDLQLSPGDRIKLVVKAIHLLTVAE